MLFCSTRNPHLKNCSSVRWVQELGGLVVLGLVVLLLQIVSGLVLYQNLRVKDSQKDGYEQE